MKFKHLLLASATGLFFANGAAYAQGVNRYGCYTDEMTAELEKKYPNQRANQLAIEQQIQRYINQKGTNLKQAGTVIKIPVVVHVVTEKGLSGGQIGGISKAQVLDGLRVINDDFRRLNPDTTLIRSQFKKFSADLEVEFVMARKDPQGNPTEGIVRTTSYLTNGPAGGFTTRNDIKAASPAWPTDKYFNIWLVQTINSDGLAGGGIILGYAQFPGTGTWNEYGLVMLHNQWGQQGRVPGTASSNGRTATHEVGHCFNLFHTFQGQCGSSCENSGDFVCDTPPALNPTFGCNKTHNTCSNDATGPSAYTTNELDQLENYMSYDDCQMMFTAGQRDRTKAIFHPTTGIPQLLNLVSPANATFTAIDPTVTVGALKPKAYFGLQSNRVCVGSPITIKNETYDGTATSYTWTFPGGTPSTSSAVDPSVTYSAPGDYDVTLTATNAAGSTSYTVVKQIHVTGSVNAPAALPQNQYVESFEDALFPNNANPNRSLELATQGNLVPSATNFERTQVAATNGTASIRLRNGTILTNTVSTLITPNIDVTGNTGNMYLTFDLAYALKAADSDDGLKIFVSRNCGNTWQMVFDKKGTGLVSNGGAVVNSFIPTSSQWRTETAIVPSNITSGGKVMIKVEATSRGGNTLYLDHLRLYTLLGAEEELAKNNINVYPNPVTPETGISFDLQNKEKVSVKIFDLVGNTVYESKETSFGVGSHNLPLYNKMENLKAGMYMVQVKIGNNIYNTKLITQ